METVRPIQSIKDISTKIDNINSRLTTINDDIISCKIDLVTKKQSIYVRYISSLLEEMESIMGDYDYSIDAESTIIDKDNFNIVYAYIKLDKNSGEISFRVNTKKLHLVAILGKIASAIIEHHDEIYNSLLDLDADKTYLNLRRLENELETEKRELQDELSKLKNDIYFTKLQEGLLVKEECIDDIIFDIGTKIHWTNITKLELVKLNKKTCDIHIYFNHIVSGDVVDLVNVDKTNLISWINKNIDKFKDLNI